MYGEKYLFILLQWTLLKKLQSWPNRAMCSVQPETLSIWHSSCTTFFPGVVGCRCIWNVLWCFLDSNSAWPWISRRLKYRHRQKNTHNHNPQTVCYLSPIVEFSNRRNMKQQFHLRCMVGLLWAHVKLTSILLSFQVTQQINNNTIRGETSLRVNWMSF